jgi:hypothetical protein
VNHRSFGIGTLRAFLILLGCCLLAPGIGLAAESGHSSLSDYINEMGEISASDWRAAAVQVGDHRLLVVQLGEAGDIYQLGNFDGMYVKRLRWKDDALLQVDWQSPDRQNWRSLVQLDRAGDSDSFEVIEVEPRRVSKFEPTPDMAQGVTNIGLGSSPLLPVPAMDRPGAGR